MLKDLVIDINGDEVSDVIIYDNQKYKNMATGKVSISFHDVIRDKRFIILDANCGNVYPGFFIHYDKETDAMHVLTTKYDIRKGYWEETARAVFSKKDRRIYAEGDMPGSSSSIDIGGQAVFSVNKKGNEMFLYNKFSLSLKNALAFTGGNLYMEEDGEFLYMEALQYLYYDLQFIINEIKHGGIFKTFEKVMLPSVPEETQKVMADYSLKRNWTLIKNIATRSVMYTENMGYLQKCGDDFYYRVMMPHICYAYPLEKSEVILVDNTPGIVSCKKLEKRTKQNADTPPYALSPAILCGMDSLKGTVAEKYAGILKDAVDVVKDSLCRNRMEFADELDAKFVQFQKKYGMEVHHVINLFDMLMRQGPFEMLYNIPFAGIDQVKVHICSLLHQYATEDEAVGSILGCSVDKKGDTLWKMYGVPKELFKYFCKKLDEGKAAIYNIAELKEVSCITKKAEDYFLHANLEDKKEILDFISRHRVSRQKKEAFKRIIFLYGPHNCRNYISFLEGIHENSDYWDRYLKYLSILSLLGAPKGEWKISGQTFLETMDKLEKAYGRLDDEEKAICFDDKFKMRAEELKRFEWQDEYFLITFPKTGVELVKEGVALHHCVKTFVQDVAFGATDVFFIRKVGAPDNPFFTMEVKNGTVRQIHGFGNRDMKRGSRLALSVESWCLEKGIEFSLGEHTYGGNDI